MESNEHKDGLEIFLKEKADAYKMYPSEKVWANLNEQLHPRKKWPYLFVAAIFLGLGFGGKIFDARYNSFHAGLAKPSALTARKDMLTTNNIAPGKKDHLIPGKSGFDTRRNKEKTIFEPSSIVKAGQDRNATLASVIPMRSYKPASGKDQVLLNNTLETGALIFTSSINEQRHFIGEPVHQVTGAKEGLAIKTEENSTSLKGPAGTETFTENKTENNAPAAITVKKPMGNRLGWQLYFSPAISYRNIYGTVNENSYSNALMYSSLPGRPKDINSAVSHSPSVGMELGTAMIYNIGKRFRIKGGLQFNYSQYNIIAYNYTAEIAPLSAAGIGHTEIKALSFHRNFDGYSMTQLRNEHASISMPVGLEAAVLGKKDVQFNIAGTLQPGLMLNNQAYLLSTNLRNYAKVPSLYRNFNVNTALEAFLSIHMGSVTWNMGPQFRYQLLSSYKKDYPIKEHLYDYGFKVGMMKTIR